VDDYLSEKEQWEAVKSWLRENGLWIIAGIALGAVGLSGWRWWEAHADRVAVEASGQYEQLLNAFERGDRAQALVLLGRLQRDYSPSPYVDQGRLAAARVYVESGELDKASSELQAVTQHSKDPDLALLARLRLARVQIAQQKPDDALATLNGVEPGAFAPRYHEVRGDAYYAKGDKANALKEYRSARTLDVGGVTDTSLLDLKISDLVADASPVPTPDKASQQRDAPAK